jgi:hypothetical protein
MVSKEIVVLILTELSVFAVIFVKKESEIRDRLMLKYERLKSSPYISLVMKKINVNESIVCV